MKFEREEEKEEEEEEEISNQKQKWSYWLWKTYEKIGFKERNINSDLAKKTFSPMIWEMCWKILKRQTIIQKEIKFR